jgi:ribosomal protein L7/L12
VFHTASGDIINVSTEAFQSLRHGVKPTDSKIHLIKAFRGLTNHGLKDSKDIVEYFLDNFDYNACLS